ncbi:DEAD/DEAH box helicase [Vibrio salinus]|uniref:DEAD/DEAH box helicase n=1 Tax=Vibrio salinus TaxID=2899784 RepID=UPI001E634125|nr:DEAD/DEAH box helicase [Vibrio salinus]MCE0496043.1 DEAD/DEAH box helicase [Vibrio salinus]
MSEFSELGLSTTVCQCLENIGLKTPTDIQRQVIPEIIQKSDVIAGAQTGSGKTFAYLLPVFEHLSEALTDRLSCTETGKPSVLIVVPTRELAQQVFNSFCELTSGTGLKAACIYGGASVNVQKQKLAQYPQVVIGTTGRLLDMIYLKALDISHLAIWVLDEGDRLLDMGFSPDIERLSKKMSVRPQTLLFSATYSPGVIRFSQKYLQHPKRVQIGDENRVVSSIEERLYELDEKQKRKALSFLIGSENWQQVLVFVRKKVSVESIAKELKLDGISASTLHGDKSQGARERALELFMCGESRVLVATDVAARGLHIEDLPVVINYDIPFKAEDYVHRIGRTGRVNKTGLAVSFVTKNDEPMLKKIEQLIDHRLSVQWLTGFEPEILSQDEPEPVARKKSRNYEKQQLKKRLKIHSGRGKNRSR